MFLFVGSKAQLTYKLSHYSLFDKGSSFTLERQQNLVVLSMALDLDILPAGSGSHGFGCVSLGNLLHLSVHLLTQTKNWVIITVIGH